LILDPFANFSSLDGVEVSAGRFLTDAMACLFRASLLSDFKEGLM
jgi:hypothetical protein